jgi:hypothetical protein
MYTFATFSDVFIYIDIDVYVRFVDYWGNRLSFVVKCLNFPMFTKWLKEEERRLLNVVVHSKEIENIHNKTNLHLNY